MENVFVDLISNGRAQGDVAEKLMVNRKMDLGAMRPFIYNGKTWVSVYVGEGDPSDKKNWRNVPLTVNSGTLRRDEWKQLDDAIYEPARQRLGGVQDLIDNGLVYNLGNAMGTTILEWHDVSEAGEADLTMDGITRAKNDRPVFQFNYLPIPILHADYQINARELEASRKLGNPLDTTMAERAARRIAEKSEDMLFTDTTYAFGATDDRTRNKIYSYLNHPDRNVVSFSSVPGAHWNDSGSSGKDIVDCVLALKQVSINAYHYGPWMLYIPTAYETVIDGDYDVVNPGITIRERIMKIAGIKGIKVVDRLTADNVLLVEMNKETVRLVRGFGLTNVQWAEEGGMVTKMKVMTIQVPQIRSDQNGKCGIVHLA